MNAKPIMSMEVFPPKQDVDKIDHVLAELAELEPAYISVTYGAGGLTADKNMQTVAKVCALPGIDAVSHLTCVAHEPAEIDALLDEYEKLGVSGILALRGDIPKGMSADEAFVHYKHASDLVEHIKARGGFQIEASCYPECHVSCDDEDFDLEMLRRKVDLGVDELVTQLFFDNDAFFRFLDRAAAVGIDIPITAGVMPVKAIDQMVRMTLMCGASIPAPFSRMISRYDGDEAGFAKAAEEYAIRQVEGLIAGGAYGIHLYTMNNAALTKAVLEGSGLR